MRKIAKDGLPGKKVHHSTVHNFIAKNHMQPVQWKFSTLLNDKMKLEIMKINLNFPNSGYKEV